MERAEPTDLLVIHPTEHADNTSFTDDGEVAATSAGTAGIRLGLRCHEQLPAALHALQAVCATVHQGDVGAHDELADGSGGQDVPRSGGRRHPGGDVDGDAADVAVAAFHLAGVQPGPDLDADAAQLVPEGGCTADRSAGPVEGRQDAVTGGLDQLPPNSSTSRRASSSWTSSSSRQRRSPSRLARPVASTMSVNRTVARMRVGAAVRWTPARKASIWSRATPGVSQNRVESTPDCSATASATSVGSPIG
jgi:hypothetical protein